MEYKMYDEIMEQPDALRKTFACEIANMNEISKVVRDVDKVYLIGCGSSISTCLDETKKEKVYDLIILLSSCFVFFSVDSSFFMLRFLYMVSKTTRTTCVIAYRPVLVYTINDLRYQSIPVGFSCPQ